MVSQGYFEVSTLAFYSTQTSTHSIAADAKRTQCDPPVEPDYHKPFHHAQSNRHGADMGFSSPV